MAKNRCQDCGEYDSTGKIVDYYIKLKKWLCNTCVYAYEDEENAPSAPVSRG